MRRNLKTIFLLSLSIFFTGCLGTRYLEDGEYLLFKQKISTDEKLDVAMLETHYNQKPNRRIPFLPISPYVSIYEWGIANYDKEALIQKRERIDEKFQAQLDSSKGSANKQKRIIRKRNRALSKLDKKIDEGNLRMRWGEPLAVYDSALRVKSAEQMQAALYNKGYFSAQVSSDTKFFKKRARVSYNVIEGPSHKIDSIFLVSADSAIYKLVYSNLGKSLIKVGQNYDQDKLTAERDRIDELLKNNGYYDFSKQYINFNIDTADGKAVVAMDIARPSKRGYHKLFRLDSVIFVTDASVTGSQASGKRRSTHFDNITYLYYDDVYSKRVLGRRVFIKKDSIYSRENTFATQRQIGNLDIFKFVNINYDTTGGRFVASIFTSPLQKFQTSNEVGLNVSQGLPGPFYNLTMKNRNSFHGLEILELNFRAGIEWLSSLNNQAEVSKLEEIGGNLSLSMPQFFLPFSNLINLKLGEVNPRTRFQVGYNYLNRTEFRQRTSKISATYSWQNKRNHLYTFSPADVSLINSTLSDDFRAILQEQADKGINTIRQYDKSLVSSINASGVYSFGKYGMAKAKSSYLRLYLESAGTFNDFSAKEFLASKDIIHYRFFKANVDFRRNYPVDAFNVIAFRINTGFARPYGDLDVLPYQKYFFAGGSNSIRAWGPRRLGPGSYQIPDDIANSGILIEQQGEIILETSIEFRRNIVGFIDGAFFVDAGNIWLFSENSKEGSIFRLNSFYREIAVGTGLGLRFDFSFLIIRTDFAFKLFDPSQTAGHRWVGDKINLKPKSYFGPVLNIGIGYPF